MNKKKLNRFFLILAAIFLFACGTTPAPVVIPPEQLGTAIVQTAAALASQTALYAPPTSPKPSDTAEPTATDTPTQTPTETLTPFIIILPSKTPTITPTRTGTRTPIPSKTLNQPCMVAAQVPASGTPFAAGAFFDTVWTVVNTGSTTWALGNVDVIYNGGTKIHLLGDVLDLPATTGPGQAVAVIVHMQAPTTKGTYSETWSLKRVAPFTVP